MLNGLRMAVLAGFVVVAGAEAQESGNRYINPPGLTKPTGYTHVVLSADRRTVYIAGQVAFDSTGKVVGVGDFRAQADQVYGNLRKALAAKNLPALREIRVKYMGPENPPANTLIVANLARPELLLEIEGVAVLPKAR